MCGIAGIITKTLDDVKSRLEKANQVQAHRGPDHQGVELYQYKEWTIGFAHQRLSILDISENAHQPFQSEDSTLIYNGEIYNYREIRKEQFSLEDNFQSESDTEVLFRILQRRKFKRDVHLLNGMWSFAYLDHTQGKVLFSRDRMGIKPFYYTQYEGSFYFASEIKTLLAMVPRKFKIDSQVLGEYLIQSLTETHRERTSFEGVYKLPSGHFAELDLNHSVLNFSKNEYYNLESFENSSAFGNSGDLLNLFQDSVNLRLRSDVPIAILLSGGIDSSSIASLAHKQRSHHEGFSLLSTVSDDPRFDESPFIDKMSQYLSLTPTKVKLELNSDNALELLRKACFFNDEPVGSFSNVAHYLLMQRAKEMGTTVILSGQGADELFCGYKKFVGFYLQDHLRKGRLDHLAYDFLAFLLRGTILSQFKIHEAKRYIPFLQEKSASSQMYGPALKNFSYQPTGLTHSLTSRQIRDLKHLSVPTLIHTEDRMGMAHSREIRVPFLDHRVVQLALGLKDNQKIRRGWTKWILRDAMKGSLPSDITWRKDKQGFVNPQSEWLKTELRPAINKIFDRDSILYDLGILEKNKFKNLYRDYCSQGVDSGSLSFKDIFGPLAAEIWLQEFSSSIEGVS